MQDKNKVVKELFEDTGLYLTYDYNLRIRKETVQFFSREKGFSSVLDMPCGTGVISIPLLEHTDKLTMIDISTNMVSIAKKNIPPQYAGKVELINDDFFQCNIPKASFDLVICLGLLAHVNSPRQLLDKISVMVKPGGLLIVQNTDSSHFYSFFIRLYLAAKNMIRKSPYKLNAVKASFVEGTLKENGFQKIDSYRYNQSFLGLSNVFSNKRKYDLTRWFFGDASANKNAWLGSDYTYLFKKKAE